MAKRKFNIWQNDEIGSQLSFDGASGDKAGMFSDDPGEWRIVHSFEASTWKEALQTYNNYYNLGPYNFSNGDYYDDPLPTEENDREQGV